MNINKKLYKERTKKAKKESLPWLQMLWIALLTTKPRKKGGKF